eukprot:11217619-Alexandrium_andersonii.AAC.1
MILQIDSDLSIFNVGPAPILDLLGAPIRPQLRSPRRRTCAAVLVPLLGQSSNLSAACAASREGRGVSAIRGDPRPDPTFDLRSFAIPISEI